MTKKFCAGGDLYCSHCGKPTTEVYSHTIYSTTTGEKQDYYIRCCTQKKTKPLGFWRKFFQMEPETYYTCHNTDLMY